MIEMPGSTFTSESISGFDPRSVADCIVWLDAADISTLTLSGTNVTGWRDKSIYANNVNSISATPPTYSSADSSINFVANSSTFLRGALSATYTDATVFMVVSIATNPAPAFPRLSILSNSATLNSQVVGQLFLVNANNPNVIVYLSTGTNPTGQGTNIITFVNNVTFNTRQLISNASTYNGTNYTVSTLLNGNTQTYSSTSGTFTPNSSYTANYNKYTLGNYADASAAAGDAFQGKLFEYIVFSRELSVTERQQVEGYLAWKWGIETTTLLPTSITGLTLWLDGADPGTISLSGSKVTQWTDKSGSGRNVTQSSDSLRPTYSAASNAIVFNATGWLDIPNALASITPTYTVFVVEKRADSGARFFIGQQNATSAPTALILGYNSSTISHHTNAYIVDLQVTIPAYAGAAEPVRITRYGYTGTTRSTVINGGLYSGSQAYSTTLTTWTNPNIGAGYNVAANWYIGNIYEVIFYNTVLTTIESQLIESYLSNKWNISVPTQALPVSHPFASIRPFSRTFNVVDFTATPEFWFDAADTSTISVSGTFLTTWLNKGSFTGSNVTPTTANTATSGTTRFNGNNLINIPITQRLQFTGSFATAGRARFIVTRQTSAGDVTYMFQGGAATSGNDYLGISAGGLIEVAQGVSNRLLTSAIPAQTNLMSLLTFFNSSAATGSNRIALNGSNVTLTTTTLASSYNAASTTIFLSHTGGPGQELGEFISFNQNLTSQQIFAIEGYLAWKWGLHPSLPATHPYKQFPPSSALPFLPRNVLGCVLWLDAADSSTITRSGVNMTQWNDKSGLSNNMLPYSTFSNVTVMSNYWNGLNVLNFSGGGVYQAPASSAVYPIDLYVVLAVKDLTTNVDVISLTPSAAVDNFNSLTFSEYTSRRWHNGSTGFSRTPNTVSPTDETSTSFLLMNWSIANNNFVLRRNGTQLSQTASYTWTMTAGSVFQLGYRISPLVFSPATTSGPFRGYIGEIVAFNSQLSSSQRQQVEGYLASKWALQNSLPITHPYRTFQPAQTSFVIITPGTIATVTLSALSGSGGTITWTTSTNAVSYKWYVGTTFPTALVSGTVGAVLTTSVSYAFIASTNYFAWVIPVSSTGTDGATTQSAAASYSTGGGITVSSSGTAADMTAAANTISGSFAGVDDSFGQLPCISFGINGTSGYTTAYVGTNGYITFQSGSGNIPSANTPSVPSQPAIKIRGFDSRGISCTFASGSKPSNANITYTRIVGNWYPYYGVNAGLIPLEIFLVRDATATKQYIWIKIGSSYNNNGYGDSDWAVTNGSSYLVNVAYPGAGTSIVFESSGFTGASWTATSPGSLVGLLT
jgi:hypothetical protein